MIVREELPVRHFVAGIWQPLVIVLLISLFAHWWLAPLKLDWLANVNGTALALIGSVIGIFLGFRNNQAYGRYWEARTHWGALVNASRSLARPMVPGRPSFQPT